MNDYEVYEKLREVAMSHSHVVGGGVDPLVMIPALMNAYRLGRQDSVVESLPGVYRGRVLLKREGVQDREVFAWQSVGTASTYEGALRLAKENRPSPDCPISVIKVS